jgi:hypothetical protein
MMLLGNPWVRTMYKMKPSANCPGFIMSEQGTKYTILVSQSTITHSAFHPTTCGNPIMKSIEIESHSQSGTCKGFRSRNRACLTGLILLHVSQWSIYHPHIVVSVASSSSSQSTLMSWLVLGTLPPGHHGGHIVSLIIASCHLVSTVILHKSGVPPLPGIIPK